MIAPSKDEEGVLLVAHKHPAGFVLDVVVLGIPAILLAILWYLSAGDGVVLHRVFTLLLPLCLLVIWMTLLLLWTNYYLDMLVVTDRRIFYASQYSLSDRSIKEWSIHDVRHVGIRISDMLGSFFTYGAVELDMEGESEPLVFERLPNPEYIAAIIMKQDDRYGELKATARKQQELLHFISHEVKGHLTKSKAAFAGIVEGDYGPVSGPLGSMAELALADSQKSVETVMSVLDNADFRLGTTTLEKKPFDLSQGVRRSVAAIRAAAAQKGITLVASVEDFCAIVGDERKIEQHVIRNVLDNALRYTLEGTIEVSLKKAGTTARLTVTDSGVGITADDMKKLFTEGGHGEHSRKMNPESTGYGLFIAKQIVEAHGGRISATSGGAGKGATFTVEFPLH